MEIEVIIDMHIEQCNVVVIIKYEIKSMKTLEQGWIYTIFHRLPEDGLKNRRKKQKRMRAHLREKQNACADCTNYMCTIDDRHSGEESLLRNIKGCLREEESMRMTSTNVEDLALVEA